MHSRVQAFSNDSVIKVKFLPGSLFRILALLLGPRGYRLAIFDYANHNLIAESLCDSTDIRDLAVKNDKQFATVGADHICFWSLQGKIL